MVRQKFNRAVDSFVNCFNQVQKFFFDSTQLYQLGLMRLILSSALLGVYLWRHLEVEYFFTNKHGIILDTQAMGLLPEFYRTPFPFFIWPESWATYVHGFFLLLMLGLVLGIGGRVWTLLTWFLSLGFLQRNLFISYGGDLIGTVWLFYLSWTKHNSYFSVLNLFNKSRINQIRNDIFSSAGARMIQLHLCILYGFTGLQKLKGASWWDGSALWLVFGNPQYTVVDLAWTAQWPNLIGALTFSTLIFEIYFAAFIWNKGIRPLAIMFGICLHIGIAISMGIWTFALVMLSPYVLFCTKKQIDDLSCFAKNVSSCFRGLKTRNGI